MRDRTVKDSELLQAAPTWIIRGSVVAVGLMVLVQLAATVGAPHQPTLGELAVLSLVLAAPVPALPTLTALFRFRLRPDLLTAVEVFSLAGVACTGMWLTRVTDVLPPPPVGDGNGLPLLLTCALTVAAVAAAALRSRTALEARRTGSTTRTVTITTSLVVVGLASLVASHAATWAAWASSLAAAAVVAASATAVAALVGAAGVELVHAVRERDRRAHQLRVHLAELERAAHDQRRQRHELSNSVATIAMASNLLHQAPDLPAATRFRLEEMLEREAEHLTDLVAPPGPPAPAASAPVLAGAATPREAVDPDRPRGPAVRARHGGAAGLAR